jgi:hypothetical protein
MDLVMIYEPVFYKRKIEKHYACPPPFSGGCRSLSITGPAVSQEIKNMALPVVEFSREGYKISKVFG